MRVAEIMYCKDGGITIEAASVLEALLEVVGSVEVPFEAMAASAEDTVGIVRLNLSPTACLQRV